MDYTSNPEFTPAGESEAYNIIKSDNNNVRSDGGNGGNGGNANANTNQFVTVTPKQNGLDNPYFHKSQTDINQFVCTTTLVLVLLAVAYKSDTFVNISMKSILAGLAAWGGYLIYINNMFGG